VKKFESKINVDGLITPVADARVPVMDRGFLYGDSIYEVFRTYHGIPLFFDEHWDRLRRSAKRVHMKLGFSKEQLTQKIKETVEMTYAPDLGQDVYVRYVVTRGEGPIDLFPSPALSTRYVILVRELLPWSSDFYSRGLSVAISETRRNSINALDPNIKGGNYLNNVLGVIEAREFGADDCLMLNASEFVTEASNSNIFFVIDGRLVTPSQSTGNLMGITKAAVHRACLENGLQTGEREIAVSELASATECFVTSATREVMPVLSIRVDDGHTVEFPEGGGELTRQVLSYYKTHVDKYLQEHAHFSLF